MARGLTQEDLARLMGLPVLTIGRWERGQTIPHPHNLKVLAKKLGVQVNELGIIRETR